MTAALTLAMDIQEVERDLREGLGLMVVGMTVVFTSLVVIGLMIKVITLLLLREEAPAEPAVSSVTEPATSPMAPEDEDTPRLIAILTAAAAAALNRPVRVHRVRHLSPQDTQGWVYSSRAGAHRQPAYRKGRT
jgi:sodium pump decarboxylase gamma subunit